jgi:hypothetical protein
MDADLLALYTGYAFAQAVQEVPHLKYKTALSATGHRHLYAAHGPAYPVPSHLTQIHMQLYGPLDTKTLAASGVEALRLLCDGNIAGLADRFGYALAYQREPARAIRDDLQFRLAELGATSLQPPLDPTPKIKYFKPNDTSLLAVVECLALTDNGTRLLVELIVTGSDAEKHVTLEDISIVTTT